MVRIHTATQRHQNICNNYAVLKLHVFKKINKKNELPDHFSIFHYDVKI